MADIEVTFEGDDRPLRQVIGRLNSDLITFAKRAEAAFGSVQSQLRALGRSGGDSEDTLKRQTQQLEKLKKASRIQTPKSVTSLNDSQIRKIQAGLSESVSQAKKLTQEFTELNGPQQKSVNFLKQQVGQYDRALERQKQINRLAKESASVAQPGRQTRQGPTTSTGLTEGQVRKVQAALASSVTEARQLTQEFIKQNAGLSTSTALVKRQGSQLQKLSGSSKEVALANRQQSTELAKIEKRSKSVVVYSEQFAKANRRVAAGMGEISKQSKKAASSVNDTKTNLNQLSSPALRYALYDVGRSLQRISVGLAAAGIAPIGFRIKYEREFADVVRTNELAGQSSEQLRKDLLGSLTDIAQATPINWSDITNIAALAGQLGIAQELVANFTENVAKFSATTDLSVDAAATGFGRLNELVDGVDGQFDKLGSAILAVGVDSVSTESQIVNVSTQIASMGNLAGLAAPDIVGLSGAIASLGIRPELARGNITRLFSNINKSVAESGFALNEYGRLTGRTAEEFADAWGSEPTDVLLDFFAGLKSEGRDAERTLRDLGITSVRDIPAFLRLGQNVDLVRELVGLSNEEFEKGTKITEQYGIISGTTAEQLKRLAGNFELFLASLGGLEGPLSVFVGVLNAALTNVTDFLSTDFGAGLGTAATGIALAGAALTAFVAAAAFALAGVVAFKFVVKDLGIDFTKLTLKTLFSAKALDVMGLSAIRTSKTFKRVALAAKALSISLGIVGVALAIGGGLYSEYSRRQEVVDGVTQNLLGNTKKLTEALRADAEAAKNGVEGFREISSSQRTAEESALDLEDAYNLVEGAINPVGKAVRAGKTAYDLLTDSQEDNAEASEYQAEASERFFKVQNAANESGETSIKVLERQAAAAKEAGDEIFVLGNNFARFIQQQAANNPELQAAFEIPEVRQGITQEFGSFPNLIDSIIGNPEDAQRRLDQIFAEVRAPQTFTLFKDTDLILDANAAELAIDGLVQSVETNAFLDAAEGAKVLGDGLEDVGEATDIAEGKIKILLDSLFGAENAAEQASNAVRDFFGEINEGSDASSVTSDALQDVVESIAGNEFRGARERIADLNVVLAELEARGLGNSASADIVRNAMIQLSLAANLLDSSVDVLPESFSSATAEILNMLEGVTPLAGLIAATTGVSLDATGAIDDLGGSAGGAAKEVKTLAEEFEDFLDTIFDSVNAAQDQAEAIADLGVSFAELGKNAFFASDEIEDAVRAITDNAESPEQAVANLQALFGQLARTVGSETDPSLQFLRNTINRVAAEFGIAASEVAEFANIDLSFFQAGVESVQEEVRTLLDFSSDLDNVISRAFDIRYADILQIDNIADAWQDLADRVDDARESIDELKASQQDLSADRSIKEYFLSVAESYGDTLRAVQLRKELAELDREQAENARELRQQQLIAGGDLSGDEPASRESRGALLDLVQEYQQYIVTLAESGASQDELREATAKARKEFVAQARELGFQESVVLEYAQAFDDVTFAINNVPRDITVDANVNPALQALNELNAKLNDSIDLAEKLNQVQGQPNPSPRNNNQRSRTSEPTRAEKIAEGKRLSDQRYEVQAKRASISLDRATLSFGDRLPLGYSEGGFTGRGGKFDPAGIVHKGEFVVPKQFVNQSTGIPDAGFLAQLQNGLRGFAQGGFVGGATGGGGGTSDGVMMVELSPFDRKLLSDAGNVQLRVNGRVVAEATNDSNRNQARRGAS